MVRTVVLLCGPPGAGKTTAARESGLRVYDRDDPQWQSERHFSRKIAELGHDPHAQAVVIRSGATSAARTKAARTIGATHVYVMLAPQAELRHRVATRDRADKQHGFAGITRWFERYDQDDNVQEFEGWALDQQRAGAVSRAW